MKPKVDIWNDYVTGTLDSEHAAELEEHLSGDADRRAELDEMKLTVALLRDVAEADPITVSEDFWPRLRDKLPQRAPRSAWARCEAAAKSWLWPSHSRWGLSARVAGVAVIVAMALTLFSPRQATHTSYADNGLTAADKLFIQQSLNKHSAYVSSQPVSVLPLPVADGARSDGDGSDDDSGGEYIP
jgi:anti-sigma-K factor RskA